MPVCNTLEDRKEHSPEKVFHRAVELPRVPIKRYETPRTGVLKKGKVDRDEVVPKHPPKRG